MHANPVNWAKFRTYGLFVKNFGWGVGVFRPGGSVGDTYRPFESFGGGYRVSETKNIRFTMKFPPELATIWAFLVAEKIPTCSQVHKNLYRAVNSAHHIYHQSLANFCGHPVHTTGAIIRYVAQTV